MDAQNTSCQGYWVKLVYVGDYGHPDTYKCMTQTEYDAYQAQIYHQQHDGDPMVLLVLGIFFGLMILIAVGAWFVSWRRYK